MKSSSVLKGVVLAMMTLVFLFQGCKGPAGPQGPPGETTVLNLEGFAADIKCGKCHTADQDTTYFVAGRVYEWSQSKHAVGGDLERNGSGCAGCHTTEGFVQRMNAGSFSAVTNQFHPSAPGCFACHSPHARGDFSLRIKTPVVIKSNITGVSDATFDYGEGNLCVQCHQTRDMSPKMNASAPGDSIAITTSRWYSHYGVQGQMLMGEGGFKFPGYTYTGNSYHTTSTTVKQEGCPTCHMAEMSYPPNTGTGKGGGHTMNIRFEGEGGAAASVLAGCLQSGCHASITSPDYKGVQTAVKANLDTLHGLLVAKGWIDNNPTSANYGLVNLVNGRRVIKPAVKAGALYNYFFVEHDLSEGVHNTKYAIELLRSSIAELRKP
jgi:hypothetical protein